MREKEGSLEYPTGFEIKAWEDKDQLWVLEYKEFFKDADYDTMKRTADIMTTLGYEVKFNEKRLSFKTRKTKDEIFNMLAGEFLGMSPLGKMTLGEVFAGLAVTIAEEKRKGGGKGGNYAKTSERNI